MRNVLDGYGVPRCGKWIDIEHAMTLYVLDMVVAALGRDHMDPFILRERVFSSVMPLLDRYPAVKEEVVRWLTDVDYRSDQCLERLREMEVEEAFGPFGEHE